MFFLVTHAREKQMLALFVNSSYFSSKFSAFSLIMSLKYTGTWKKSSSSCAESVVVQLNEMPEIDLSCMKDIEFSWIQDSN